MICSYSCACWDLKGERLHIHYCLPENLILRGIGIVSFVSYYNSLITIDSVDLNTGKRSSAIRSALNTRQLELLCCSGWPKSHSLPWATCPTTRATLQILLRKLLSLLVRVERGACPPVPLLWAALGLIFHPGAAPISQENPFPSIMLWGWWTWSASGNEEKVRKTLFSHNYLSWVQTYYKCLNNECYLFKYMKEGWHANVFQMMFQGREEPKASISKVHLNVRRLCNTLEGLSSPGFGIFIILLLSQHLIECFFGR